MESIVRQEEMPNFFQSARLKKDIIIKAGTIFKTAPSKTVRHGKGHLETSIGLSDDTCGSLVYTLDDSGDMCEEYFEMIDG